MIKIGNSLNQLFIIALLPMSNIIQFPIKNKFEKELELDEEMNALADEITSDVIAFLIEEGYEFDNEANLYEISLFYEAAKSLMYSIKDKQHPLQFLANELYSTAQYYDDKQLEFDFDE